MSTHIIVVTQPRLYQQEPWPLGIVNSYHSCYSTEYCDKINQSNLEVNSYHSCYSTIIILLVCTLSSYFKSQSKAVQTSSRLAFTLLTSPICPQITLEPFAGKKCVHAKEWWSLFPSDWIEALVSFLYHAPVADRSRARTWFSPSLSICKGL